MANLQQKANDALSVIDAALAILNRYPSLDEADGSLSLSTSVNPFEMITEMLKSTAGYNKVIQIISKFLLWGLYPLEYAVKAILFSNIKNMINCTLNPFVTRQILKEGIVLDLDQIDLMGMLNYSPFSQKGKTMYFGCDKYQLPDEILEPSNKDINALLWYMKHKANSRHAWKRKSTGYLGNVKTKRKDGIITLEYNERSQGLTTSDNNGMFVNDNNSGGQDEGKFATQIPYSNCLHVFLGNVEPYYEQGVSDRHESSINSLNSSLAKLLEQEKKVSDKINKCQNKITSIQNKKQKSSNKRNKETSSETGDQKKITKYTTDIEKYDETLRELEKEHTELTKQDNTLLAQIKEKRDDINAENYDFAKEIPNYRTIDLNYYYRRTLIQFNWDYLMSIQLFDTKTVAHRLIDSIVSLASIDLDLTYQQRLVKEEIRGMVKKVVSTDDIAVSDCFFSFSNDQYNAMLEKTELAKAGMTTFNGIDPVPNVDIDAIFAQLDGLNEAATQEGQTKIIEGVLYEVMGEIATVNVSEQEKVNGGIQTNFVERLLENLGFVITQAVLSPAVYMVILINLKICGQSPSFDLKGFIDMFKNLIVQILREIRDQLIKYLVNELMKIIGTIAKEIAVKIGLEQAQYYARLIKRCIDCFKNKGTRLDWEMDKVDYADILDDDNNTEEDKTEC